MTGRTHGLFVGAPEGLVLFRNELTHIFLPGQAIGRIDRRRERR